MRKKEKDKGMNVEAVLAQ